MTALTSLNAIVSTELELTINQHILQEQQNLAALNDWLTVNRTSVLTALDTLASLSVAPLQAKILANECTTILNRKQYELTLTLDNADLRAVLDDALACPKCLRLLTLITEYNDAHLDSLLTMGGIRKISADANDYLIYFSTR
jgi:hypothetical protein